MVCTGDDALMGPSKIWLFCSSCNNQEFNTTGELNKHMGRHNGDLSVADPLQPSAGGGINSCVLRSSSNDLMQSINLTSCVHCGMEFTDEPSLLKHQEHHAMSEIDSTLQNYLPSSSYDNTVNSATVATTTTTTANVDGAPFAVPSQDDSLTVEAIPQEVTISNDNAACEFRQNATTITAASNKESSGGGSNGGVALNGESHEKPFKCDRCPARFANQTSQKRHKDRVHDKIGLRFSCKECAKSFFDKHDLARHEKTHGKSAASSVAKKCDKCHKKLKAHKNHDCKVKVTDFPCKLCDAYLENQVSWGYHMWKHTKDPKYIPITPSSTAAIKPLQSSNSGSDTNKPLKSINSGSDTNKPLKSSNSGSDTNKPLKSSNCDKKATEKKSLANNGGDASRHPPAPPEAHAVNSISSQFNQPLCLQTSGFVKETEVKPLNMQVTCNVGSKY